jgi:hypothetical protein
MSVVPDDAGYLFIQLIFPNFTNNAFLILDSEYDVNMNLSIGI